MQKSKPIFQKVTLRGCKSRLHEHPRGGIDFEGVRSGSLRSGRKYPQPRVCPLGGGREEPDGNATGERSRNAM